VVADDGVEEGHDPDRVQHVAQADLGVGRDPVHAPHPQVLARVGQEAHRLEQGLRDDRLHDVELQLSRLGSHRDSHVVAHHLEANLVDDLWQHRVHLGRHDRRAGLELGQVDLVQARTRTRGEQPQVVADLAELDRDALDRTVHGHVGTCVRGCLDEVLGEDHRQTADLGELRDRMLRVAVRCVQAGADGGRTEVDLEQQLSRTSEGTDLFTHENSVDLELLPERHGDGVL